MHSYHFPKPNYIRHGDKINLPYFLFTFLVASIAISTNPPLHQGLIYIMYKDSFEHSPHCSYLFTLPRNLKPKEEAHGSFVKFIS